MKRLFLDLDVCSTCEECAVACSYLYHPQNSGIANLREYATFATICRHCDMAPCVNSCYHNALERQPDGHLKRYKMRCTSCKSCTIACPFGVIFPEFIPYLDSRCDYCVSSNLEIPSCVRACSRHAIEVREFEQENPEENLFFVGDSLAVKTSKWSREDLIIRPKKK